MYNRFIIIPSQADFHIKRKEEELEIWVSRKLEYINDHNIVALADQNIERLENSIKELQTIAGRHNS